MTKKRASENALGALHEKIASAMADKIESGEYTAADMANAIRFLKDNGINADLRAAVPHQNVLDGPDAGPFDEDTELDRLRAAFSGPPSGRA
jgi:hypothetical protein